MEHSILIARNAPRKQRGRSIPLRRTLDSVKQRKRPSGTGASSSVDWKRLLGKPEFPYKETGFQSVGAQPIQRYRFVYNAGDDGVHKFDTDDLDGIKEWVRKANRHDPKLLVKFYKFLEADTIIPSKEKNKVFNIIAEILKEKNTETLNPELKPLGDTIYGLDIEGRTEKLDEVSVKLQNIETRVEKVEEAVARIGNKDAQWSLERMPWIQGMNEWIKKTRDRLEKKKIENVRKNVMLAYKAGFRTFDAAFDYQNGRTADLFQGWPIDEGAVQIIYKFKVEQAEEAFKDMENLANLSNVLIHTAMLHEMPDKNEFKQGMSLLKNLSTHFKANAGISNVQQQPSLVDVWSAGLILYDMIISSVENRVSAGAPDVGTRNEASHLGIDYLGYGLQGSVNSYLCRDVASVRGEHFLFMEDPFFKRNIADFGLKKEQGKGIVLAWARSRGIKALTSSRDPKSLMDTFPAKVEEAFFPLLDSYGDRYEKGGRKLGIYKPLENFLKEYKVGRNFYIIKCLSSDWVWESYYKDVICNKENGCRQVEELLKILRDENKCQAIKTWWTCSTQEKPLATVVELYNFLCVGSKFASAKEVREHIEQKQSDQRSFISNFSERMKLVSSQEQFDALNIEAERYDLVLLAADSSLFDFDMGDEIRICSPDGKKTFAMYSKLPGGGWSMEEEKG